MNGIQNYTVNFRGAKTRMLNDTMIEKMVADFNKKVLDTKISGDFKKDMQLYVNMSAESNKILHKIVEESKNKTISYDCAKTQIRKLENII